MDYYDYRMRVFAPSVLPITLNEFSDTLTANHEGRTLIKTDRYQQNYIDMSLLVQNIESLQNRIIQLETSGGSAHIANALNEMDNAFNSLANENDELRQRIQELEMLIKEN